MWDCNCIQFLGIFGCIILIAYLITEFLDWTQLFSSCDSAKSAFTFGYANHNGPHTWKDVYPESRGKKQSPVNIATQEVVIVNPNECLVWFGYSCQPQAMKMTNDGNSVVVTASWPGRDKPNISGGPLMVTYEFRCMQFHWGQSDMEGSEHTINFLSFPLELQMVHDKHNVSNSSSYPNDKEGLLIMAYLFEIIEVDNPYLDNIVRNLWGVELPNSSVDISPFPLDWLYIPYKRNYYTYEGSLTQPPCSEVVTWIIQPEPIGISRQQVAQFRKLRNNDGPLLSNVRSIQLLNRRRMYYYS